MVKRCYTGFRYHFKNRGGFDLDRGTKIIVALAAAGLLLMLLTLGHDLFAKKQKAMARPVAFSLRAEADGRQALFAGQTLVFGIK